MGQSEALGHHPDYLGLPHWQYYITRADQYIEHAMFDCPKIHEIKSAPDMVHPASTAENPITAAYVLVIRDRSPERFIDDEFLDWNYILWWRRNDALNRELCLALKAETLVPDGEPQANDYFLEFRKDKLRFGDGKNQIRRSPDAPDLHETGAAAEGFMAALVSTPLRSIAPKTRRFLPDQETSPVLLESGLRLYDLYRGREYISVSIGVPSAGGQQADRILGRVRFDEFEFSPEFGRLSAIPACGVDERLVDFLRDYGVGSYESKFDLNTLFSTQCLARLQVGRNPGTLWPNACSVRPSSARTKRELPSSEMGGVSKLGGFIRSVWKGGASCGPLTRLYPGFKTAQLRSAARGCRWPAAPPI
jgi:hypothetical protein